MSRRAGRRPIDSRRCDARSSGNCRNAVRDIPVTRLKAPYRFFVLRYPTLGEALLADVSPAYRLLLAERADDARPAGPEYAGLVAVSVN